VFVVKIPQMEYICVGGKNTTNQCAVGWRIGNERMNERVAGGLSVNFEIERRMRWLAGCLTHSLV
jgi:hypothetical protein